MLRVFSGVIIFVLTVYVSIWLVGYFQPSYYKGELTEFFTDRRAIIWQSMVNVDLIPHSKNKIEKVEILEDDRGLIVWKEYIRGNEYRIYSMLEKREPYKYVVELTESSLGLTGVWTYFLEESVNGSMVTISEESENRSIWTRGVHAIIGRNTNLKQAMKSLRVALYRRLIDSP